MVNQLNYVQTQRNHDHSILVASTLVGVAQGRNFGVKRQPYLVEDGEVLARQVLTRLVECFSLERARCKLDKALGRRVRRPFGELAPTADWQGGQAHRICHLLHTPGRRKQQKRRLYGEGHHRPVDLGADLNIRRSHGLKPVFDPVEEADLALRKLDSEQIQDAIVDLAHHRNLLHDNKRALVLLDLFGLGLGFGRGCEGEGQG